MAALLAMRVWRPLILRSALLRASRRMWPLDSTILPDMISRSRGTMRPGYAGTVRPKIRGRRESRVPVAPAASRAKLVEHASVVTTGSPVSPGLPCAMVLAAYFVLSPATGLFCHRRLRNCFRKLDASVGASGPHDFTVRIGMLSSAHAVTSIASRLASVTIASRPSCRDGTARNLSLIWGERQCRRVATDWHDGQFAHNVHARSARRAKSEGRRPSGAAAHLNS
jgi:hypothetical protein